MINLNFTNSVDSALQERIKALAAKYPALLDDDISINAARLRDLLSDLESNDSQQLCNASLALGDFGDERAIVPLAIRYYAHQWNKNAIIKFVCPHPVRAALAIALYNLGENQELKDVLFSESGFMRLWMVAALKQLDNEHVVACLIRALSDQDAGLVYWAVRALGEHDDKSAVEPLIATLRHPYIDARVAAADSLRTLGDERALAALEQMRQGDDE